MCGAVSPFPQFVFKAWCLIKCRENYVPLITNSSLREDEIEICFGTLHKVNDDMPSSVRVVHSIGHTSVYPEVSGLTAWNENCKWYNSLPLSAVVTLFYESV
jgi:hypothetical protein